MLRRLELILEVVESILIQVAEQLWTTLISQPAIPVIVEEQFDSLVGLAILSLNASFRVAVQEISLEYCIIGLSYHLQQLLILTLLETQQIIIIQYTWDHCQAQLAFPTVWSRTALIPGQMEQFTSNPQI
jgi:hypothetical protein